jgi:hypothetical protein
MHPSVVSASKLGTMSPSFSASPDIFKSRKSRIFTHISQKCKGMKIRNPKQANVTKAGFYKIIRK